MHRLGAAADGGFLHLDEIPDHRALVHARAHAQMRKWSNRTVIGNVGINDETVVLYGDSIAEPRIDNARPLVQFTRLSQHGAALNVHVRMNHAITPELGLAADVAMRRVDKSHSRINHQTADGSPPNQILKLTQFSAGVDAGNLADVRVLKQADPLMALLEDRRHVRQVILALTVGGADLIERSEQLGAGKTVYP